jgi:hypothetical protein
MPKAETSGAPACALAIETLFVVPTQPRNYHVTIAGAGDCVCVSARQLASFTAFNAAAIEQIGRCFPPVSKREWSAMVDAALSRATKESE